MRYIIITLLSSLMLFSCNQNAREQTNMIKMNKSFKTYIRDNDIRKDLVTDLKRVEVLSYVENPEEKREHPDEKYEAQVYMYGTTSFMNSSRIYNMKDTVTCYFDENFRMLRLVNPNDN